MTSKPPTDEPPFADEGGNIVAIGDVRDAVRGADHREPPPKRHKAQGLALPDGAPVVPLGYDDEAVYFIDASGQLRRSAAKSMGQLELRHAFSPYTEYLYEHWPRIKQDGNVDNFRAEQVADAIFAACAMKGVWNPTDRVRELGAWRGDGGELILHCGDEIIVIPADAGDNSAWAVRRVHRPKRKPGRQDQGGLIGEHVYPAARATAKPFAGRQGVDAGRAVLDLLAKWNWRRGALDEWLMLGWIGCAMRGGALDWRPMVWVTARMGSGKSWLLKKVLAPLLDNAIVVDEATEPGIRRRLGFSSVPVIYDEAEAERDDRRMRATLALFRNMASGGVTLRGEGADGAQWTAKACGLFASINVPALKPAEISRFCILDLDKLVVSPDDPPLKIDQGRMRELGRKMLRRMVDTWPGFEDDLDVYRRALIGVGHEPRGADVFGHMLATAHALADDRPVTAAIAGEWAAKLRPEGLREWTAVGDDDDEAVQHMLGFKVASASGQLEYPLAYWLAAAYGLNDGIGSAFAKKLIETFGLKVIDRYLFRYDYGDVAMPALLVARKHAGLASVFRGTHWRGSAGATPVYTQAFERMARKAAGIECEDRSRKFAGVVSRAVALPLNALIDTTAGADDDERGEAAWRGESEEGR